MKAHKNPQGYGGVEKKKINKNEKCSSISDDDYAQRWQIFIYGDKRERCDIARLKSATRTSTTTV